jgi:hypothetical protein
MKASRHLSHNFSKVVFETIKTNLLVTLFILCFGFISIGSVSATSYGPWTATSGTVTHQTYTDNMSNTYSIQPTGGGTITLTWNSFDTEATYDYVTVYDGNSTSGTQLGRWAGNGVANTVIAYSGSMYITFTTDGSVTRNGWSASYSTVSPSVTPGSPTSVYGTATGATTANIYWSAGSPVGTPAPTYYWVVSTNSSATYGSGSWYGTGSSTSISGLAANTDYYLRVYSSNSAGSTAYVTSSAFKTYPANPTSISATSSTVCSGTATTLTANGAQGTVYWYTGGCGSTYVTTGNTYTPSPSSSTTYYARNNNGNWSADCASTTITVNAKPAISSQSTLAQTICLNGAASALTVSATGAGLSYQWYSNTSASNTDGTSLGTATGAQSSSYTPLTTSLGTKYYYCIVSGTCSPSVTSSVSGAITINAIPVSGTLTPNVAAGVVCAGTSLSATLTAGSGGAGTIADVLQYRYDGGSWTTYTSGTSLTTTGHTSVSIQTYRTASASGCTTSTANVVSWTVNALPAISSQSTALQSVILNGTATAMTVTTTGAGISYQWYSNTSASNSGGTSLGSATGAQSSSYTPLTTSVGTTYYYCIVSGTCTPTVTSAVSGAITVYTAPTTQATNVTFSNTTDVSTTVSWTNGNGSSRAVFIKTASSGTASPVNGTTYTANTSHNSGSQIGSTGWYCVYNGTGTSVTITNITTATAYSVMVIEYNGAAGAQAYFTSSGTNNPNYTTSFVSTFNYLGTNIINWTVPAGVTSITIDTYGAQGGSGTSYTGGLGARMKGSITVTPGQVLKVLVGQQGGSNASYNAGGGGGGSFVTTSANSPLVIAGGGSGGGGNTNPGNGNPALTGNSGGSSSTLTGGSSGLGGAAGPGSSGGGGLTGDGANSTTGSGTGGKSFTNGGYGGAGATCAAGGGYGGFGGGSGGEWCNQGAPGAGGGYSGGAGTNSVGLAGAGGSYILGAATNQTTTSGTRSGNGLVTIVFGASAPTITTIGTFSAFAIYQGTVSTAQSTIVSAINLTENITATAPTGYEVSLASGSGYASSITLTQSSGIVSNITIYLRLTNSASGTPSGNLALTSTGATTVNVAATGTVYVAPSTQASNVAFSGTTDVSTTLSWVNGNGSARAVFMKAASTGTAAPVNGTIYTHNTVFGSGTQIGSTGWYCVYNGTGTTVTVTNLVTTNTYMVMVTEFNGLVGSQAYQTTTATINPNQTIATVNTFNYSGSIVNWTVPAGVTSITIDTYGAQGGTGTSYTGGLGARMKGSITVTPGQVLKVLVGQQGGSNASYNAGGGGGGSFVTTSTNSPLVIAGGGSGGGGNTNPGNGNPGLTGNSGGSSTSLTGGSSGGGGAAGPGSSGGGGLTGDGANSTTANGTGGKSFTNGGYGGAGATCAAGGGYGGFGGGSGGEWCNQGAPGAGGGYSGGAGTNSVGLAGAGGSYILNTATSQTTTSGTRSGNGLVTITTYNSTTTPTITTSGTLTAFSANAGSASTAQSFSASATGLTANITVTAPNGFEVCLTSGGTYTNSLSLTQTDGTVASTTVYVRLSSVATGTPSGNVTLASTGATTVNVAVSGTVNALPTISSQPAIGGQNIALNGSATVLTITAAAGSGSISTYQWYKNTTNANTGGTTVGTNAASYTPLTSATGTLYYYCVVTNSNTGAVTSNVSGAITVYALPSISAHPSTSVQNICLNGTATALTITASAGSGSISGYQWYKNASNTNTGGTSVGTSDASYTPVTTSAGALYYYCVVTNSNGGTLTSNVSGKITIAALPTVASAVTASPTSVCSGAAATLNATSTGNNINWYTAATGGTSIGTSASGANFVVNPTQATTYYAEAQTISASSGTQTFNYTGTIDNFTVPAGVTSLVIEAKGAQGGTSNGSGTNAGGKGAYIKGTVSVTPGQVLKVLVGGQGSTGSQGGGGGGSFITTNANAALVVAGGGGGAYYASYTTNAANADGVTGNNGMAGVGGNGGNGGVAGTGGNGGGLSTTYSISGAGGGGLNGNGTSSTGTGGATGGKSFTNGGTGGIKAGNGGNGGFGGGGGGDWLNMTGAGGGGGYSGGGGGTYYGVGGGGGSYNAGTNQTQTAGYQTGNGQVILSWTVVSSASCPAATRTAVSVGLNTSASVASVTGSTGICVGSTSTYTANTVVLAGGTGAFSSSNTAVATVVASTGVATGVSAGTCNIIYTITGGCGGTVTSTKAITVSALPVLAAITGTTTFCKLGATTLANSSTGGTWSSASTDVATVDASSGVVTGVTAGTALITYTFTNGGGCTNSISNTVTVTDLPTVASSVTATPSTVLSGSATNLNATSTSNTINWFTAASGGTSIGSSASGANLSVTPSATTTYYAEAVSAAGTNGSQTFSYTGSQQTLTVPAGVTAVSIEAYGAQGGTSRSGNGNLGGKGGYAKGNLAVTPGQTLYIYVGGQGGGAYNTVLEGGGWNGGGHSNGSGDGGGGASDIRVNGTALSNRVIVAGGGGGNGWYSYAGGAGGGLTGSAGGNTTNSNAAYGGGGGTQSAGGVGSGTYPGLSGTLGNGGNGAKGTSPYGYSGGGGGGYYGGAGGAAETGSGTGYGSAGGGGSSYIGGVTNATTTSGSRSGNGQILISWLANAVSCPSENRTAVTVTVNAKPTVTTDAISAIAGTTATGGGNVTADGGATVTARGICWSTSQNPTVANTTNGTGIGTFTSSITGLTAGTTYYVRAYATNAMGTSYGNEVSFKPYTLGTFANINKTYGNAAFVLVNPTSTSTGTFSYESSNTNVATISGNTVTIVGAGSSTITCTQNATSVYAVATKTATLTVAKANQVLTLSPLPSSAPLSTLIGTPQLITATSSAGLTVTPSIASGPATVTFETPNYYLTSTGSIGTAVVQVNQAGNDNYNSAQITHSIDVTKGNQTITFGALTPVTYSNGLTLDLTANSSSALSVGLAVVSGPASISGNTLTITGAGTVVITASQNGNASWNAATSVTRNLTVNKAAASITFAAINKTFGDVDFTATATSASTGAFSYRSGTTATATVSGTIVSIEGAGTSTITVNQAASDDYIAGSTTALLTVDKANQTISIDAIADVLLSTFEAAPIQITATSTSGLTVELTAAVGSKASINGSNQAVSTGVSGNVTINANQAGDDNYNAASQAVEVFAVNKANQTVTFAALAGKFSCDDAFELTATSTSELAPTFTSSNEAVATVSGTTVTIHGAGETTITAAQVGNAYFSAASSVGRTLTVTACVAPTIAATTTVTAITSTTATSGGNVTADGGGAITERGICWSTSPNPEITDSKSWGGTGTGTFESSMAGLSANTLYYVRAYATNSVNTVYGTQVSFTTLGSYTITASSSNQIIGSVTGSRDVDAGASISVIASPSTGFRFVNWTENDVEVSTAATYTFTASANRTLVANFSSLTVNVVEPKTATVITNCADCDVTVANTGTLTVDASNKTVNSVTVEPGGKLVLTNPITVQDLTLKADNSGSFSTTVGGGMTVNGTFRYIKSMDDVQWYFISFPCEVLLASEIKKADGTSLGAYGVDWAVFYYDGDARTVNLGQDQNWKKLLGDRLVAYKGYAMALRTGMGTVDVAFTLNKSIIENEIEHKVPVVAYGKDKSIANNHKGWNLVGQPYLSRYSGTNAGVEYMVFSKDGGNTYVSVPKLSGELVNPFTAYFVQADAALETNKITFDITKRESIKSIVTSDITDRVDIIVNSVSGTDKTGLIIDVDQSPAYVIGQDMTKWLTLGNSKPQIYTMLDNQKYAYNALPMTSVVDLPLGVYNPNVGPSIISANATSAPGLSQLLLTDKTTGIITDLLIEPYNYVATAGTTNTRFVLNAKRVATNNRIDTEVGGPSISINNYKLIINNLSGRNVVKVYDAIGRMLITDTAFDSTFEMVLEAEGVYTIQIQSGLNSWTKKVVYNR